MGGGNIARAPIQETFPNGCAVAASDITRGPKARMTTGPMVQRVIGASCVHGRVGAFYTPCAGERNHIVQINTGSWPLWVRWGSAGHRTTNATAEYPARAADRGGRPDDWRLSRLHMPWDVPSAQPRSTPRSHSPPVQEWPPTVAGRDGHRTQ